MNNPIFFIAGILSAVCAVFAPPILNLVLAWCAYMYFKMSAD